MEKSPLQAPTKAYGTENAYPTVKHYEESQSPSYEEEVDGYSDTSYYQGWEGSDSARDGRIDSLDGEDYADLEAEFDAWDSEEEGAQVSDLRDLKRLIQASELSWEEKKPLLESLMKAQTALDLGKEQEATEHFQQVKDEFEGSKEEKAAETQDQKVSFVEKLKGIEDTLAQADIPEAKKDRLRDKIKSVNVRSSIDGLSIEKLSQELDDISKEIGKAKAQGEIAGWFKGFSAHIPQNDYVGEFTARLGGILQQAIESGSQSDWNQFKQALSQIHQGDPELAKSFKEQAVAQLIGTMFYTVAGMDEGKLERMLDAIPKDVREAMIQVCLVPDWADDTLHCGDEEEKQKFFFYGTGRTVASRLQQSLTKDDSTPVEPLGPRENSENANG